MVKVFKWRASFVCFDAFMQELAPFTSTEPLGYLNDIGGSIQPECDLTTNPYGLYAAQDSFGTLCYGYLVPWWAMDQLHPLVLGYSRLSREDIFELVAQKMETDDYTLANGFIKWAELEFGAEKEMLQIATRSRWSQDKYRLEAKRNRLERLKASGDMHFAQLAKASANKRDADNASTMGPEKRRRV